MRLALGILGAAVLLAGGAAAGWLVANETVEAETVTRTETETDTQTETATVREASLPEAVEETRAALLAAAEAGRYERLQSLLSPGFRYTFGSPVEGGPIGYWRELQRTTGERPLATLATLLRMPYVLARGIYVWPFAYGLASADELTPHEREVLAPLGTPDVLFTEGTGYLGWRAGIEPDGTWVFFLAGD